MIKSKTLQALPVFRAPSLGLGFRSIRQKFLVGMITFMAIFFLASLAHSASRIKDIANVEGVRDNLLVGYGLVVGLNGTGDDIAKSIFTKESLIGMLERLGVTARDSSLKTDNTAAVMVTAVLPPFARQGTRIDVNVSALGDAQSLQGGTLLVTPLVGADGEVYAVGQGPLAIGGFQAGGNAETITRGVPTNGKISNGAIVERELGFEMRDMDEIQLSLRNPDFTTARRIAQAVNQFIGQPVAASLDPTTVKVRVPASYNKNAVNLITDIEQLRVSPDNIAKVVVDENTGVIVMGENVRINTVAIAQGNLTIRITETQQVSQPNPFANLGLGGNTLTQTLTNTGGASGAVSGGTGSSTGGTNTNTNTLNAAPTDIVDAVTVDRTNVQIDESTNRKLTVLQSGVSLQELVNGLNALGVGPRDMITILQAIKAAGALQAEIEVI